MKKEKYTDFFEEAEKGMSKDNIRLAEQEANKIMLNLGLAELRKHAGQHRIDGLSQYLFLNIYHPLLPVCQANCTGRSDFITVK